MKEAIKSDNVDTIKAKTTALAQAAMKLGEALYGAQQPPGGADASPGANAGGEGKKSGASGENVVDAEFTDVNDKDDKKKSA